MLQRFANQVCKIGWLGFRAHLFSHVLLPDSEFYSRGKGRNCTQLFLFHPRLYLSAKPGKRSFARLSGVAAKMLKPQRW